MGRPSSSCHATAELSAVPEERGGSRPCSRDRSWRDRAGGLGPASRTAFRKRPTTAPPHLCQGARMALTIACSRGGRMCGCMGAARAARVLRAGSAQAACGRAGGVGVDGARRFPDVFLISMDIGCICRGVVGRIVNFPRCSLYVKELLQRAIEGLADAVYLRISATWVEGPSTLTAACVRI